MKHLFGLILLLCLSFPLAFAACPADPAIGTLSDYRIFLGTSYICTSGSIDLHNSFSSGETTFFEIAGNLTLENSFFQITDTAATTIIVNSTGTLILKNNSIIRHFDSPFGASESVEIIVRPGGNFTVLSGDIRNSSGITLQNKSYIQNLTLSGNSGLLTSDSLTIKDSSISVFGSSLEIDAGNFTFVNSDFLGNVYISDANVSFRNSDIRSRIASNDSVIRLYNSTFIDRNLDNSTIYQYWPVSILILNELQFPLYGITVTAKDGFNTTQFSDITYLDGLLVPDLLSLHVNETATRNYSNYTIFAEEVGGVIYSSENVSVNIAGPTSINLTVETAKGIIRTGDCDPTRPFCTQENPVSCGNMTAGDTCLVQFVVNGTNNFPGISIGTDFFSFFMIANSFISEVFPVFSDNVSITFSE